MDDLPDFGAHGYRAEQLLGVNPEGGRVAYRGVRIADGLAVVIKRFSFANREASWASYQAHERELDMLRALAHPRIPAYVGDFQSDDGFCIVQEYRDARPMSARRIWSPGEVEAVARSVLEVLVYLQDQMPPVIHRDLKPGNILVDASGEAHLVDFGLARADRAQATTIAVGTPGFVPPEQILGHELTTATDLYGLGAALVSALTGTPSAQIGSLVDSSFTFDLSRLPTGLDPSFRAWLERMVAPSTKVRFGSAREALAALDTPRPEPTRKPAPRVEGPRRPVVDAPPKSSPSSEQTVRRSFIVAGALTLAAAAGAVWAMAGSKREARTEAISAPRDHPLRCTSPMTLTEDITMRQQHPAIIASAGCELTMRDMEIKGHIGIVVEAGRVTLERVDIDTVAPAIELKSAQAIVEARQSRMSCGARCVILRDGSFTLETSTLEASIALDVTGGQASVVLSTLAGGQRGLVVHRGAVTLADSRVTSPGTAIQARARGVVRIAGGHIAGGLVSEPGSELSGWESAQIELGAGRDDTWTGFACEPIFACAGPQLGTFSVDLRAAVTGEGVVSKVEILQRDALDEARERCIVDAITGLRLPGPDGGEHAVRCAATVGTMAGGATQRSVDFRVER